MSYQTALEAAGAKVLAFREFGDYQGTWYALVNYQGKVRLVSGGYGSCSGCDAWQSEFDGWYNEVDNAPADIEELVKRPELREIFKDTWERLVAFGEQYLKSNERDVAQELAEKLQERDEWNEQETDEIVDWLKMVAGAQFQADVKTLIES